jgi:hypothetical protein
VKYLTAFAVGLYLWFFSDTIGDASLLGVSEGFTGGAWHVALWVVFAIGVVLLFSLDPNVFTEGSAGSGLGFAIPLLVAVACFPGALCRLRLPEERGAAGR